MNDPGIREPYQIWNDLLKVDRGVARSAQVSGEV